MSMIGSTLMSLGVIAALVLGLGGGVLIHRGERRRGGLMIAVGVVLLANVVIASVPL